MAIFGFGSVALAGVTIKLLRKIPARFPSRLLFAKKSAQISLITALLLLAFMYILDPLGTSMTLPPVFSTLLWSLPMDVMLFVYVTQAYIWASLSTVIPSDQLVLDQYFLPLRVLVSLLVPVDIILRVAFQRVHEVESGNAMYDRIYLAVLFGFVVLVYSSLIKATRTMQAALCARPRMTSELLAMANRVKTFRKCLTCLMAGYTLFSIFVVSTQFLLTVIGYFAVALLFPMAFISAGMIIIALDWKVARSGSSSRVTSTASLGSMRPPSLPSTPKSAVPKTPTYIGGAANKTPVFPGQANDPPGKFTPGSPRAQTMPEIREAWKPPAHLDSLPTIGDILASPESAYKGPTRQSY